MRAGHKEESCLRERGYTNARLKKDLLKKKKKIKIMMKRKTNEIGSANDLPICGIRLSKKRKMGKRAGFLRFNLPCGLALRRS